MTDLYKFIVPILHKRARTDYNSSFHCRDFVGSNTSLEESPYQCNRLESLNNKREQRGTNIVIDDANMDKLGVFVTHLS